MDKTPSIQQIARYVGDAYVKGFEAGHAIGWNDGWEDAQTRADAPKHLPPDQE